MDAEKAQSFGRDRPLVAGSCRCGFTFGLVEIHYRWYRFIMPAAKRERPPTVHAKMTWSELSRICNVLFPNLLCIEPRSSGNRQQHRRDKTQVQ